MKIIVLGGGLVGKTIATDISKWNNNEVFVADINAERVSSLKSNFNINGAVANLSDPEILSELVKNYDLVIGALPGFMGYSALKSVIENGKNIVDISFFPEDPFTLHELAVKNGVTAIVDCGVAPGCSNMILGYSSTILDHIESFTCHVGGLPKIRKRPFEYKAPFSPADVIEEYLRPARFVENGEIKTVPALSEPEFIDFDEIGTLESFLTDGLRTLLKTAKAVNMKEKTLRYAGHREKILFLKEAGFLGTQPINVKGKEFIPMEITSSLLFPQWELKEREEDLTVMKIIIEGKRDDYSKKLTFDLFDTYDNRLNVHSMARTTGYTCSVTAKLFKEGIIKNKGIVPPEILGQNTEIYKFIMLGLKERNIIFRYNEETI